MHEIRSPKDITRIFFSIAFPAIPTTVLIPIIASIKYSGGPNLSAWAARNGEKNKRTRELIIPPNTELVVEMLSASPAFPFWVIG